jgi:hypothetical protein
VIVALAQLDHLAHRQPQKAPKVSAMTGQASLKKTRQEMLGSKHVGSDPSGAAVRAAGIRGESQSADEKARLAWELVATSEKQEIPAVETRIVFCLRRLETVAAQCGWNLALARESRASEDWDYLKQDAGSRVREVSAAAVLGPVVARLEEAMVLAPTISDRSSCLAVAVVVLAADSEVQFPAQVKLGIAVTVAAEPSSDEHLQLGLASVVPLVRLAESCSVASADLASVLAFGQTAADLGVLET